VLISLAHATLLDLPPAALVRAAHAAGFQAVGLRLIPIGLPDEPRYAVADDPDSARDIRRALDETGIQFLDVEVVHVRDDVRPLSYARALEGAAALGARFAIVHVYTDDASHAADDLGHLCDLAMPLGVTMLLEPEGLKRIVADILAENTAMQRLCRELGFTIHRDPLGDPMVKAILVL
jgi:sugar phosphate isomerase/epimerase